MDSAVRSVAGSVPHAGPSLGSVPDTGSGSAVPVTLHGDVRVRLQPLTPADRGLYLAGFEHLSPESRLKRFLTPKPSLTEREIRYFTEVDHHDHEAIAASIGGEGIGVARYIRDAHDAGIADVAVAVVDGWQRRGMGTALLRRLAERAREEGVSRFRATMQWANRPMFATIRRLQAPWRTVSTSGGVVEVEIRLLREPVEWTAPAAARFEAGIAG